VKLSNAIKYAPNDPEVKAALDKHWRRVCPRLLAKARIITQLGALITARYPKDKEIVTAVLEDLNDATHDAYDVITDEVSNAVD